MAQAALVTGGAKRLGKYMALALAEAGYDIALHYNTAQAEAEATAQQIRALGRECQSFQTDLNDASTYARLVKDVFTAFPACSVLVNSASIFERCSFKDTTEDVFDRHMNINFKAPFFLTQAFAKQVQGQGCVVNMLDSYATRTTGSFFSYLLSKKVFVEFNAMAARDLAPHIRVNGICPGTVLTSTTHPTQEAINAKSATLPLQKAPTPEDINKALLFLIESDFLTGECIYVDAGQRLI